MKRVLSTVLVIGILLSSASCVSQSQYDELEQRVAALENERNNASIVNPSSQSTEIVSDATTSAVDVDGTGGTVPEEVAGIYSWDGMSADEIVNMMITYTETPSEGSTDDDFMARFPSDMAGYYSSSNGGGFNLPSGSYLDTVYADSYMSSVQWYYSHNMDGTIMIVDDAYSLVSVSVIISDYDTAVAIYESLSEVAYATYGDLRETTEGSNWSLADLDYVYYDPNVLSMNLTDYGYRITYINYFK